MSKELEIALKAAHEGGKIALKLFRTKDLKVEEKGSKADIATEADNQVDQHICRLLSLEFPHDSLLSEEGKPEFKDKGSSRVWVIDSIDGTNNFRSGFAYFAISIALVENTVPILGVIYDPVNQELLIGEKGKGTRLYEHPFATAQLPKEKKASVSSIIDFNEAIIHVDLGYKGRDEMISKLLPAIQSHTPRHIRMVGSAVKTFADVALGRAEAYVMNDLKPWDCTAGVVIVREAGGKVTRFNGEEWTCDVSKRAWDDVIASNQHVHSILLKSIQHAKKE